MTILSRPDSGASRAVFSLEQQEQARQTFNRHAGAISLGYATGTNNEAIEQLMQTLPTLTATIKMIENSFNDIGIISSI